MSRNSRRNKKKARKKSSRSRPRDARERSAAKKPRGNSKASRRIPQRRVAACVGVLAVVLVAVLVAGAYILYPRFQQIETAADPVTAAMLDARASTHATEKLDVLAPLDGSLFPADFAPPTFRWDDPASDTWVVSFAFDRGEPLPFRVDEEVFTPSEKEWKVIRRRSRAGDAPDADTTVTILGAEEESPDKLLATATVRFRTSADKVDAPIFYREVNLPFIDAVKDPTKIRWRFGEVSSAEQPPVVLEGLPVCGNCHSFPADGETLAMDVDYANSKGSYVITPVEKEMTLASSDIITWNDYSKEDGEQTFGLLSQISPDGRYVISTVKDKAVFVPRPDLEFSQLFFPIRGILVVYDRETKEFRALPGADDPEFVQSNPTWSPDGTEILFARSEAYNLQNSAGRGKTLLTEAECEEFLKDGKPFLFDLYRVPFNDGAGGTAVPVDGASQNGMSNYFAKFSPDGKWIVFCKSKSYMLLQPDSELWIIPAAGGEARRLECNTSRMNSWHSFSPNGRWMVFSSKVNGPYTQLFLTHFDAAGRTTPPVVLSRFTAGNRAANIPEFVNNRPGAIVKIRQEFVDDYSHVRAGDECYQQNDAVGAVKHYRQAVELNPRNAKAHQRLGFLLYYQLQQFEPGMRHMARAIELHPTNARAHYDLGIASYQSQELPKAVEHLTIALELLGDEGSKTYSRAEAEGKLGISHYMLRDYAAGERHLARAVELAPKSAEYHYALAIVQAASGKIDEPLAHLAAAKNLQPDVDQSAALHFYLAKNYQKADRIPEASIAAGRARKLAPKAKSLLKEIDRLRLPPR